MPAFDSWMVLTLRVPFVAAILIIVFLIALLTLSVISFRRKSRQVKMLTQEVNAFGNRTAGQNSLPSETSTMQEAYLQFTYNISHEVSNPLQSVQTNLENMADCSPEETGRWRQYYTIIKQEIRRIFTLTENLRLLSQLERVGEPVKREPVNLKGVIEDVIMAQAERASARGINLRYEGPNRPAKVLGNREHLYQLIINLVDNSVKYAKESGGEIVIRLKERDNSMQVMVVDNGIGILEEDLPFVFDTAYRSPSMGSVRRTGSGLGLAIVKRIVDQHEGQIGLKSLVGEGTTVTVDLPLYNPAYQA